MYDTMSLSNLREETEIIKNHMALQLSFLQFICLNYSNIPSSTNFVMGEIFTNLMNFQQFVNIFPIKIFHLVSYLPLINLWQSGTLR